MNIVTFGQKYALKFLSVRLLISKTAMQFFYSTNNWYDGITKFAGSANEIYF